MRPSPHDDFLGATLPAVDLVYNLARRAAVRGSDVDDLVQETYARAFEAWMAGRRPRKVEPWLATICLNAARSAWRRAAVRNEIAGEPSPLLPSQHDVESGALEAVHRDAVHRALWQLPDEQRIAITLMDLNGFTAAETARIVGSPRGTVLARVHRGRKTLARLLDRKVNVEP